MLFRSQRRGTIACAGLAKVTGEPTIQEKSRQKKRVKPDLLDNRQSSGLVVRGRQLDSDSGIGRSLTLVTATRAV